MECSSGSDKSGTFGNPFPARQKAEDAGTAERNAIAHVRDLTYIERTGDEAADPTETRRNVPVVHFGTGTGELLLAMRDAGADVVGVDYRVPLDVANLTVAPDGSRIAFSLEVFPDCPDLACTTRRLEERAKDKTAGMIFDGGFFRHWDTWSDGRRNHLFTAALEDGKAGEPVDVTRGMEGDTPSRPFGGAEEFTFTPDHRSLVFTARAGGPSEPWSTNFGQHSPSRRPHSRRTPRTGRTVPSTASRVPRMAPADSSGSMVLLRMGLS